MTLGFISGLEDHVQLSEGAFPREGAVRLTDVEVLVSQTLADQLGVQVGERYTFGGAGQQRCEDSGEDRGRVAAD